FERLNRVVSFYKVVRPGCRCFTMNRVISTFIWRRARDLNPRDHFRSLHDFQSCSFGQLGQLSMAPQAGFEPATDRLTADCSTTELLWNNHNFISLLFPEL